MDNQPEEVASTVISTTDLDNMPTMQHNWVLRNGKLTCGGAGHAYHEHTPIR